MTQITLSNVGKPMACELCQKEIVRRSIQQRYCPDCSEIKSRERNRNWARKHPPSKEYIKERQTIVNSRFIENGLAVSKEHARKSLFDSKIFSFDKGWSIKFSIPYSQAASKNHLYSLGKGGGHLFKRQEIRQYQDVLALQVKAALRASGHKVYNNKVWIDLFVQKPNHKSDAINVLDVICDALKIGLNLDDRWFSVRQLDWEIAKNYPQIFVSIYQTDVFDAQVCSHCGRIQPLQIFTKKKSSKTGHDRVCKDCRLKKK